MQQFFFRSVGIVHKIKNVCFIPALIFCVSFVLNKPQGRPTSTAVGTGGEKTNIKYNVEGGAAVYQFKGRYKDYDESGAFKRYSKDVTDWTVHGISPLMIPEDRELAYKYYSYVPGAVWVEKLLFCDETEVTNLDWDEYRQLSGDTTTYRNANPAMEAMKYNISEQVYYFPVVNVSYEAAVRYCKWRTEVVTAYYNNLNGYMKKSPEYTVFEFSLPTKEEWIKCAASGTDTSKYPHVYTAKKIETKVNKDAVHFLQRLGSRITETDLKLFNENVHSDYPFNCKREENTWLNLETPFYVWDYPMNNLGIYNMLGNVSEMTLEKGIAKGGSYRDPYADCTVNHVFKYTSPADNLGFRCVCKLKWPNK
ncbi:MAG: formylglycine-generating enzyme family protein [Cytophaga sp.]|uniref:formylglycine-generating enzyme family protein n=1 Tax=Cytophaga sp. TaxID=29535 RepID=UPI003F8063D4